MSINHSEIASPSATSASAGLCRELAAKLAEFMETGKAPAGLFTPDVFCDFTMPQWRLQAQGQDDLVALRLGGHPGPSRIPRSRLAANCCGPMWLTAPFMTCRCTAPATGIVPRSPCMRRRSACYAPDQPCSLRFGHGGC